MLIRWGAVLVLAVVLAACAGETSPRPAASEDETTPTDPAAGSLEIRVGDVWLVATLRDTAAARDLRSQLPARVTMRDHGGVEKTGPLERGLDVTDEPSGADPDVGDLGYYAPGHDLVLYYGDQSYYDGIVVLGRLEGDLAALAELEGDLDVHIRPLGHDS